MHRRDLLQMTGAAAAVIGASAGHANAQPTGSQTPAAGSAARPESGELHRHMIGYMLAHEQFALPELHRIGMRAAQSGFDALATSDHFQPWQANEGHAGLAWVALGALAAQGNKAWMGTTVTCPTLRYSPAVVAEAFASLSQFAPGHIFLGVGSGEALNEEAATGTWPKWQERWDRLIEAVDIIRGLWGGQEVNHQGTYYTVNGKLYDKPMYPIPILTAANGRKSMRLAGQHGDGLITDPMSWKHHKSAWEGGARDAGKDPATMPVLVEQYVVVGDKQEAARATEFWRFGPKAFNSYFNIADPAEIQRRAEAQIPIEKVEEGWAIGTDPEVHIKKIAELFDSGATIVNIHTGQPDQEGVLEFYATKVLPQVRQHYRT